MLPASESSTSETLARLDGGWSVTAQYGWHHELVLSTAKDRSRRGLHLKPATSSFDNGHLAATDNHRTTASFECEG